MIAKSYDNDNDLTQVDKGLARNSNRIYILISYINNRYCQTTLINRARIVTPNTVMKAGSWHVLTISLLTDERTIT